MTKPIWWIGALGIVTTLAVVIATHADPKPSTQSATNPIRTGLSRHEFTAKIDKTVHGDYLLCLPETYGKDKLRLPLILFLHGSGERGKNPNIIGKFGPPRVSLQQKGFPFIVLAPQCPAGKWWTDVDVTEMVMALLDQVCKDYLVDTKRIYLTGMSMGGFGAWDLAQKYPDRWAALAVVCGGGNPYLQMRVKNIPTKVFHGAKDKNVPVFNSHMMAGTLKQFGGQVDLKVYPNLEHNCWTVTYDDPGLYEWFLQHQRGKPAIPSKM
ncbi:MAG: prolyl oligopeptidase family serine peptidase [Phycisphaerae bacterium]|nr:prolyl oligopeptidase family serine peptidase [Phycisphaerae bacterium]